MTHNMSERLDDYPDLVPESWKPKPGDKIAGELVRYDQGQSPFGPCWLAVLRVEATKDHGEYLAAVWLSHKVLMERFKALRPKVGEHVGIKRLSDAVDDDGATRYARYAVLIDGRGDTPDWNKIDAPEAEGGKAREGFPF